MTVKDFLKRGPLRNEATPAVQSAAATMGSYTRERSPMTFVERTQTPASSRPLVIEGQKVSRRESLTGHGHGSERTRADWSPLSRVFRRMEAHQTPTSLTQNLLVEELVNRVTHERLRIEQAIERAGVVRRQKKEFDVAETDGALAKPSISGTGRAQGFTDNSSSPQVLTSPAINIAELTEQVLRRIDSQIVAQKERLGKPF
jgi:hypothetical protein